jgi:chaperonin GroEL (HSP60 family)
MYEEARYIYDLCKPKLNEGYKILLKEVGYDDIRNDLFMEMASDDFIILEGGD